MELRRSFLYLKQYWEEDVSQVLLCGDMPEIRSLTAPLIERLNIEVETLDTLEGIDGSVLPDGFGERASTLRLASSIAVEPPPVNLLPVEVTAGRTNRSGRTIVIGGTAAAVALGAFLYGQASVARTNAERQLDAARREMSSLRAASAANDARAVDKQHSRRRLRCAGPGIGSRLRDGCECSAPGGGTAIAARFARRPSMEHQRERARGRRR